MASKMRFRALKIDFTPLTATDEDVERFREMGYTSYPVIFLEHDDGSTESWCGFSSVKFDQLKTK